MSDEVFEVVECTQRLRVSVSHPMRGVPAQLTRDQNMPFRMLDLPPELWSRIGGFAVTDDEALQLRQYRPDEANCAAVRQPDLTRTCRIVRKEALKLFYRNNRFIVIAVNRYANWTLWLSAIGPENRRYLQHLYVTAPYPDFPEYITKYIKSFPKAVFESRTGHVLEDGSVVLAFTHKAKLLEDSEEYVDDGRE